MLETHPLQAVIQHEHFMVHLGQGFTFQEALTLSATENHNYLLLPDAGSEVHLLTEINSVSGETSFRMWEGPNVAAFSGVSAITGGNISTTSTPISACLTAGGTCASYIANRNRIENKNNQLSISGVANVPLVAGSSGVSISWYELGSQSSSVGQSKAAGSGQSTGRPEWVLRPSQYYLLQVGSKTAGNRVSLSFEWYQED